MVSSIIYLGKTKIPLPDLLFTSITFVLLKLLLFLFIVQLYSFEQGFYLDQFWIIYFAIYQWLFDFVLILELAICYFPFFSWLLYSKHKGGNNLLHKILSDLDIIMHKFSPNAPSPHSSLRHPTNSNKKPFPKHHMVFEPSSKTRESSTKIKRPNLLEKHHLKNT